MDYEKKEEIEKFINIFYSKIEVLVNLDNYCKIDYVNKVISD